MKTITREIQAETAPFVLWDLHKDETTFYNKWCLEWFEDYRRTDNIDLWDNDEWLQDLYDGEKKHKKEFKQFVKKHYTNVYWKEVYKEFKEIWELKDKLSINNTPEFTETIKDKPTLEAADWSPTMELRWVRWGGKHLQQKWRSNTGCEEWRHINEEEG